MHCARSITPGMVHSGGKERVKVLKCWWRSWSLIEEEVKGPLIWSWLERAEVQKRIGVIDLERMHGRRSITPGKFTLDIYVCGDVRTPEGQRVRINHSHWFGRELCVDRSCRSRITCGRRKEGRKGRIDRNFWSQIITKRLEIDGRDGLWGQNLLGC